MIVLRLFLRFILVPFGALAALVAAVLVAVAFHWSDFVRAVEAEAGGTPEGFMMLATVFGPLFAAMVMASAGAILMPSAVGALIAEIFAIRSWIFHAVNGGLSAWIGASLLTGRLGQPYAFFEAPLLVAGAGVAAGFAYWAVAGWSAGFWRPVFGPPEPRRPVPPPSATPR